MTAAAFTSAALGNPLEGALLLVLFAISGGLENSSMHKAKSSLRDLHKLTPQQAYFIDDNSNIFERSIHDIEVGNHIIVKAGETVPLDGIITEGSASINISHLTGESTPITKNINDSIVAGAHNINGYLNVKVTKNSSNSTITQLISMITQAQEAKPKLQHYFDKFSTYYASSIIIISALIAILLPAFSDINFIDDNGSIYRALSFLIAASPCALIIALPITYLSALSACAKKGILLKGTINFDSINQCQAVAFDKTGTLTTAELNLSNIQILASQTRDEQFFLRIALSLEKHATHPIAQALIKHAQDSNLTEFKIKSFSAQAGYGVQGYIQAENTTLQAAIGNIDFIKKMIAKDTYCQLEKNISDIQQQRNNMYTIIYVDGDIAVFTFEEELRPFTKQAISDIATIKKYKYYIISGDHKSSVAKIAKEVSIDNFYYNLKPQDKLDKVTALSQEYGLIMIGDGANDAPALAQATIGISMGEVGSSTSIDVSDIVLLHDDLHLLPWLLTKAGQVKKVVYQNIYIASIAIVSASTLALLGAIPLWLAVTIHEGATVIVGLNGLRLLRSSAKK